MLTEEQKAAQLEAEKQAAEAEANNGEGVETDGGEGGDGADADVEKKDYSKMSDEEIVADLKEKHADATPEELLILLAKDKKVIGHKNRAINSLKKPKTEETKPKEEVIKKDDVDDLDKPITKRDLIKQNNMNAVTALANTETNDPEERKAILNAYENDIVQSGDIAKDFKKALAIASVDEISEFRKNRSQSEQNENQMTNFSGAVTGGASQGGGVSTDAKNRAVAENLRKAGYSQKEIDESLGKK
jgi:hypothetical protein